MMRVILIVFCLVMASCSDAKTTDRASAPIMAQENAWMDALLASNMETVDALMHPNFRLVRSYAKAPPIDKAAYLGMLGMSVSAGKITSANIDVSGNVAVAQITMTLDWQQESVGKLPPHFELTDIWLQGEDGVWRIITRISQTVDAPPSTNK